MAAPLKEGKAVVRVGRVAPGGRVLINGASAYVAAFFVQIASTLRADVTGL